MRRAACCAAGMGGIRMLTDYLALDLETTGLSPERDRIIEIGAVKYKNGMETERFSRFVKIYQSLPEKIIELTGITDKMLSGGDEEKIVLTEFLKFAKGMPVLLGHNIGFDFSFLKVAAARFGMEFEREALDTLLFAKKLHPELASRTLSALCAHYKIVQERAHRAVDDAISAHRLYQALAATFPEYDFLPQPLFYQPKKQEPMTLRQKKYLSNLLHYHGLEYTEEMDSLNKSDASRMIDRLIFTKGRLQT